MRVFGGALALAGLFCLWYGFFGIYTVQAEWVAAGILATGGGLALLLRRARAASKSTGGSQLKP